jgi:hypothetical protein
MVGCPHTGQVPGGSHLSSGLDQTYNPRYKAYWYVTPDRPDSHRYPTVADFEVFKEKLEDATKVLEDAQ